MKFDKLKAFDTFRWERIKNAELVGKYDMPKIQPVHNLRPENLVPFHMTKTTKNPGHHWFHFYEDDYQFERLSPCAIPVNSENLCRWNQSRLQHLSGYASQSTDMELLAEQSNGILFTAE